MSSLARFVLSMLVITILVLVWAGWTAGAQTGRAVLPSREPRGHRPTWLSGAFRSLAMWSKVLVS